MTGESNITFFSMHFGRIFINLTDEEDEGFRIASSNVTAVEFEDKSLRTKGLPLHPNLMIVEIETERKKKMQQMRTYSTITIL